MIDIIKVCVTLIIITFTISTIIIVVLSTIKQSKSILNENHVIDSINKLTSNSAYYICDKNSKDGGYVIVDFIYNDIKKVHCYWTQDDDLFDDFIEFDDYDFYEFKIPRMR